MHAVREPQAGAVLVTGVQLFDRLAVCTKMFMNVIVGVGIRRTRSKVVVIPFQTFELDIFNFSVKNKTG